MGDAESDLSTTFQQFREVYPSSHPLGDQNDIKHEPMDKECDTISKILKDYRFDATELLDQFDDEELQKCGIPRYRQQLSAESPDEFTELVNRRPEMWFQIFKLSVLDRSHYKQAYQATLKTYQGDAGRNHLDEPERREQQNIPGAAQASVPQAGKKRDASAGETDSVHSRKRKEREEEDSQDMSEGLFLYHSQRRRQMKLKLDRGKLRKTDIDSAEIWHEMRYRFMTRLLSRWSLKEDEAFHAMCEFFAGEVFTSEGLKRLAIAYSQ